MKKVFLIAVTAISVLACSKDELVDTSKDNTKSGLKLNKNSINERGAVSATIGDFNFVSKIIGLHDEEDNFGTPTWVAYGHTEEDASIDGSRSLYLVFHNALPDGEYSINEEGPEPPIYIFHYTSDYVYSRVTGKVNLKFDRSIGKMDSSFKGTIEIDGKTQDISGKFQIKRN